MPQFCSRCGTNVEDPAAAECPQCKAPLAAPTHPADGMTSSCTVCGRPAGADQLVQYQDQRICPDCKPAFFQKLREGIPGAPAVIPQGAPIPFEADPGVGTFFSTIKLLLTSPLQTMRGQKTGEGVTTALAFFLLIQIPVVIIGQLWNWASSGLMARFMPGAGSQPRFPGPLGEWVGMMQHPTLVFALLFALGGIIIGFGFLFINAGLIHLIMRLLGGGSQGYGATLKALCYCVAPMVLGVIPICLNFIGIVWMFVLQFMLVGPSHRESTGKGALAVLLYYVLCCTLGCIFYFVVIAAMVGGMGALAK